MKISDLKWNVKYDITVLEDTETQPKGTYHNCQLECIGGYNYQADFYVNLNEDVDYEDISDDDICVITQNDLDSELVLIKELN